MAATRDFTTWYAPPTAAKAEAAKDSYTTNREGANSMSAQDGNEKLDEALARAEATLKRHKKRPQ